ncbi:MAG: hypothetical protein ABFS45_19350 [Pseudomonadota bacterium]
MNSGTGTFIRASDSFHKVAFANQQVSRKKKSAPPFSLRLTAEERTLLEQQAGSKPLGAYIRERLLGDRAHKRRASRRPRADEKKIALVLAELGRSRLSSNLNQLAKSANMGTLDISRDVEQELHDACGAGHAGRFVHGTGP